MDELIWHSVSLFHDGIPVESYLITTHGNIFKDILLNGSTLILVIHIEIAYEPYQWLIDIVDYYLAARR